MSQALRLTLSVSLYWLPLMVMAQGSSISIDSQVDKSTVRVGDPIKYTIIVTRTPDVEVEMPGLAANLGAFEIQDYQIYDAQTVDNKVVDTFEYTIAMYDVGEYEIPPLEFQYTVLGDTTAQVLKTKKMAIEVESIVPSEAGDIQDIEGPSTIMRSLRQLILWGGLGALLLVSAGLVFYVWRRKRSGKGILPEKVEPPRPAHEVALERLRALEESSLLKEGKTKEFYIEISEIIRRYIEGRYFVVAIELTTFELVQKLESSNVEDSDVQLIQGFLEFCDLAKFAKYVPSDEENVSTMRKAVEIVEKTKLVYDQPAEDESAEKTAVDEDEASTEDVADEAVLENDLEKR